MITLLKENDFVDVLQFIVNQRGGWLNPRLQRHEHLKHEVLVFFVCPGIKAELMIRWLVEVSKGGMMHLDESIPQKVDVDPTLDVIWQLLPVFGPSGC